MRAGAKRVVRSAMTYLAFPRSKLPNAAHPLLGLKVISSDCIVGSVLRSMQIIFPLLLNWSPRNANLTRSENSIPRMFPTKVERNYADPLWRPPRSSGIAS